MSARDVKPDALHGHDPHWWVGRLSVAVAMSVERPHPRARETLDAFLQHGQPTPELRKLIREELRT